MEQRVVAVLVGQRHEQIVVVDGVGQTADESGRFVHRHPSAGEDGHGRQNGGAVQPQIPKVEGELVAQLGVVGIGQTHSFEFPLGLIVQANLPQDGSPNDAGVVGQAGG